MKAEGRRLTAEVMREHTAYRVGLGELVQLDAHRVVYSHCLSLAMFGACLCGFQIGPLVAQFDLVRLCVAAAGVTLMVVCLVTAYRTWGSTGNLYRAIFARRELGPCCCTMPPAYHVEIGGLPLAPAC